MEKPHIYCRQCNEVINILKGRSDRLYCDERCKNKYHNERNKEDDIEFKRVQKILRTNRKVLKKVFERKDRNDLPKEKLVKGGFEFEYHTHTKVSKFRSYLYTFCFEYGYRPVGENKVKVVRAFDYKEE